MMNNKRGMSAVITTLIIILLVIVALGIIWVVVKKVIDSGVEQVEWAETCRPVELNLVKVSETSPGDYDVTLSRTGMGDKEITGVKIVLSNSTDYSGVIEFGESVPKLETKTMNVSSAGLLLNADSMQITPYFIDDLGAEHLCETNTEEF